MKITIKHFDKTHSVEMEDSTPIHDVIDEIQNLLSCVWHPETVKEYFANED